MGSRRTRRGKQYCSVSPLTVQDGGSLDQVLKNAKRIPEEILGQVSIAVSLWLSSTSVMLCGVTCLVIKIFHTVITLSSDCIGLKRNNDVNIKNKNTLTHAHDGSFGCFRLISTLRLYMIIVCEFFLPNRF